MSLKFVCSQSDASGARPAACCPPAPADARTARQPARVGRRRVSVRAAVAEASVPRAESDLAGRYARAPREPHHFASARERHREARLVLGAGLRRRPARSRLDVQRADGERGGGLQEARVPEYASEPHHYSEGSGEAEAAAGHQSDRHVGYRIIVFLTHVI